MKDPFSRDRRRVHRALSHLGIATLVQLVENAANDVTSLAEAQPLAVFNGAGPFTIANKYFAASGESRDGNRRRIRVSAPSTEPGVTTASTGLVTLSWAPVSCRVYRVLLHDTFSIGSALRVGRGCPATTGA